MSGYMTRALQSSDPRFAQILETLGHKKPAPEAPKKPAVDPALAALREEYEDAVGRRPFMGWDADKLREKIAEAKEDAELNAIADDRSDGPWINMNEDADKETGE